MTGHIRDGNSADYQAPKSFTVELFMWRQWHRRRNRSKSVTARGPKGWKTRPKAESGVGFWGGGFWTGGSGEGLAGPSLASPLPTANGHGERCKLPSEVRGRQRILCIFGVSAKLIFTNANLGAVLMK